MQSKVLLKQEFKIQGGDFVNAGESSCKVRNTLREIGIESDLVRRIAIAAYEAEMNIVMYAHHGTMQVNVYKNKILLTIDDTGPGIEDIDQAMQPGFSTAKKVTDISGRGVGMDVVKKAIEKLRGRAEIRSRPGQGSTFILSLPLTLAIIEGMLVRVGQERYIIPALAVLESFQPAENQYSTIEGKGELILSRGKLIPLIRLDRLFGVEGDSRNPWNGLVVAVEHQGERRCLLLDELLGKEEVVIKSLTESLKNIKGIAGGAIMGDGRVGLIVDISGIFELAHRI